MACDHETLNVIMKVHMITHDPKIVTLIEDKVICLLMIGWNIVELWFVLIEHISLLISIWVHLAALIDLRTYGP